MLKFEYRGLNLLDEIGVVEVAYDSTEQIIHLKDHESIVWPNYVGNDTYKMSDEFWNMAQTLQGQFLFRQYQKEQLNEWIDQFTWLFYQENKGILFFQGEEFKGNIQKNASKNKNLLIFNDWIQV